MKSVIAKIAEENQITLKLATSIVKSVIEGIQTQIVSEEKVRISGLGTFSKVAKPACTRRNPKTGEPVECAAKVGVKFKAGKELLEAVV